MMKEYYEAAVAELKKFCEENTRFSVEIVEDKYPLIVRFKPIFSQMSLFDKKAESEMKNGHISVVCGLEPMVRIDLKLEINNSLLKKMVSKAENVGAMWLHYKCQEAMERNAEE